MATTKSGDALGRVVEGLLAYRGWASPEKFAQSFTPARLSAATVRRIMKGSEAQISGDEGTLKLMTLAGMLQLPVRALVCVRDLDVQAIRHLDFRGETDVRQFIAETIDQVANPPRNGRATDKKRASGG